MTTRLLALLAMLFAAPARAALDVLGEAAWIGVPPRAGETALLELRVRNVGDVVASNPVGGTGYETGFGADTIQVFATAQTPPCEVHYDDLGPLPNQPVFVSANVSFPAPIAPGESGSCIVGVFVHPDAPEQFTQLFVFLAGSGMPDATPADNVVSVQIGRLIRAVPVGGGVLLGLLLLVGAVRFAILPLHPDGSDG